MSEFQEFPEGKFFYVHNLKRDDLNGMIARVVQGGVKDIDGNQRVGVNIAGKDYKIKGSNLSAELGRLLSFKPHVSRIDLHQSICPYDPDKRVIFVLHRAETIKLEEKDPSLRIFPIALNKPHIVIHNLIKSCPPVLSPHHGYLGDHKCDLRDMSAFTVDVQHKILYAAKIEDSCGSIGTVETENEAKPWSRALPDILRTYKESVDTETSSPHLIDIYDGMLSAAGREFNLADIERVANYFADGCIPKYYFGVMHVILIQPRVVDLTKCELRPSNIGGVGGLGCFLRLNTPAKAGELVTLYPACMLGKHYDKSLVGDVELNHHIMAQVHNSPEWQMLGATDPDRLIKQAKRYSVTVSPAPGCAMFVSHPPSKMDNFDPAWIGHMVNSTKDGTPVANCTLVGNLFGGFWWGVAALDDIPGGTELIVDYGSGWFETHPDRD
jgi:hypothetical protein